MDEDPPKPIKYTLYIYRYIYINKLYCETKTFCEGKDGGKGKMTNCKILMVKHNYNLYLSVVFKGNCPVLVLNEKTKI